MQGISKLSRQPEPLYLCLEIDQFSAQVIAAYDAYYKDKPFAVVSRDKDSRKTRVLSCLIPAKRMNVTPGMAVYFLKKQYPDFRIVLRNRELEKTACEELERILYNYTPKYEIEDNGECLADLSGTPEQRLMNLENMACKLKNEIRYKIGLQWISIGISRSRLVARIIANTAKPDGIRICEPGQESAVLAFIDARFIPGLSVQCRQKLKRYGVRQIGRISSLSREALMHRFGKEGEKLYALRECIDSKYETIPVRKLYTETVLKRDINDNFMLRQDVGYTVDKLCYQLKRENMCMNGFTFILTYSDNKTVQKRVQLYSSTNDFITVFNVAYRVFNELYQRRVAVKSLKLIVRNPKIQIDRGELDMFETLIEKKQELLGEALTKVRNNMRFSTVLNAANIGGNC